jgi:WD40 repeat protein/serine/threonine protein kinase
VTERDIFLEALEMTAPEARAAYLQRACGQDVTLRRNVDELLKEHFSNDSLLAGSALEAERRGIAEFRVEEAPAQTIGRYKLLEKLGEGGFGEVWMADQREPVKRRVALKIIKLGMDSRQIVARFEAERQALAMMDHANIARIFDAGLTDSGRPYFVMELVRGIKITEYCDQNQLPTQERLKLFILVCQAIQHAHQKGVIHRDIKPSNILVTLHDGVPVPKVIDFGIAKATQQELTDKTVFTQFQQFIGTPAYISPEQAEMSGLDIDTRADIYSLGVLLYELLVGQTPFDPKEMMQGGLDALRQIIREKEPLRPSTKLNTLQGEARTTAGKRRQTDVGKLVHQLQGDLDWIVMKCLEKDRKRRYDTANGLAADLKRHLNNEPVVARPASNLYRFQKLMSRNRLLFFAGGAVAAALVLGLGVTTWMFFRERTAKREQVQLRQEAQRAQAREEQQRRTAEAEEFKARQNLYAADMNLAYQALERGNLGQVRQVVAKYSARSDPDSGTGGRSDLRGWEWRNLWQRSRGDEMAVLSGHSNVVAFAGLLPDSRTVVSASRDRIVRFWDLKTRQLLESVRTPDEPWCGALSSDGRWLVVGGEHGCWSLWDPTSRELRFARTNSSAVKGVAFSSDSAHVAVGSADAVEVWNVQGFRLIAKLARENHDFRIGLAFSPDGKTLAYSQGHQIRAANTLMLWNLETGLRTFLGTLQVGGALGLAFNADGRALICGERSGISLWDTSTCRLRKRLTNHAEQVISVALSPNGKLMASTGGDQTVTIWDTQSWEETRVLRGHELEVHSVTFSSDGKKLLSAGKDAAVRVWDVHAKPTRRETYTCPPGWLLMPGLPDTPRQLRIQLGTGGTSEIGFLDLTRCEEADTQPSPISLWPNEIPVVSGDLSKLAIPRINGAIEIWSTAPFAKLHVIGPSPAGVALSVALSRTGSWLAIDRGDGYIEIRDLAKDRPSTILDSLPSSPYVGGIRYYPNLSFWAGDSRFVRVTGPPGELAESIDILLFPGMESKRITLTHKDLLNNFSLSNDGRLLATSAFDGQVILWDIMTGKEIHTFTGQFVAFISLAFSSDGSRLAAGGMDGSVTLWDLASLSQVAYWKAHARYATRVCFLDGGDALMTTGSANTDWDNSETRIWRPPSLAEIDATERAHSRLKRSE